MKLDFGGIVTARNISSKDDTKNREGLMVFDSILDVIGCTPLIRLNKVTVGLRARVLAKAEFLNIIPDVGSRHLSRFSTMSGCSRIGSI